MATLAEAQAATGQAQQAASALSAKLAKLPRDDEGKVDLAGAYTPEVLHTVAGAMVSLERAILSDEVLFGLTILDAALSALGTSAAELLATGVQMGLELLSSVCDALLPIIQEILAIVPVIGAVIGAVIAIVKAVFDAQAADTQALRGECNEDLKRPVRRIGQTATVMPSDIFAYRYSAIKHPDRHDFVWERGTLLGDTLRVITGDERINPRATDGNNPARRAWDYENTLRMYKGTLKRLKSQGVKNVFSDVGLSVTEIDALGLSEERRSLYADVRRAIEIQSGKGDGGAVMWLAYQDLLMDDFYAKRITYDSMQWLCNYRYSDATDPDWDGRNIRATNNVTPGSCASLAEVGEHSFSFGNGTNAVPQIIKDIIEPRRWHLDPQTIQDRQAFQESSKALMLLAGELRPKGSKRQKVMISRNKATRNDGSAASSVAIIGALAVGAYLYFENKGR